MTTKKDLIVFPQEVLMEMEQLQIRGGDKVPDIYIFALGDCGDSNIYCGNSNCVTQCGCKQ